MPHRAAEVRELCKIRGAHTLDKLQKSQRKHFATHPLR